MKKLTAVLTAVILCAAALAGCAKPAPDPAEAEPEAEESVALSDIDEAENAGSETETDKDVQADGLTVACDLFEITIPEELADLCETEVQENRIDIYHKESKDAGFGGLVLSLNAMETFTGFPYVKIGEVSNEDAVIYEMAKGFPTDPQFDYTKDEMPEDYRKLYDAAEEIIGSLTGVNGFTYVPGAGAEGEGLYTSVLIKYAQAFTEGWDNAKFEEENMSPEFGFMSMENEGQIPPQVGYAYKDINGDGIDELFLGEIAEEEFKGVVYDIYTIVDHRPAHVASGFARDRYYAYDDSFVCNAFSSSAFTSGWSVYALMTNSAELVFQWGYLYDEEMNAANPWFKTYDGGEYETITEEEFTEAQQEKDHFVRFDYLPLCENEDVQAFLQQ